MATHTLPITAQRWAHWKHARSGDEAAQPSRLLDILALALLVFAVLTVGAWWLLATPKPAPAVVPDTVPAAAQERAMDHDGQPHAPP